MGYLKLNRRKVIQTRSFSFIAIESGPVFWLLIALNAAIESVACKQEWQTNFHRKGSSNVTRPRAQKWYSIEELQIHYCAHQLPREDGKVRWSFSSQFMVFIFILVYSVFIQSPFKQINVVFATLFSLRRKLPTSKQRDDRCSPIYLQRLTRS